MGVNDCTPSHDQTIRMIKEGTLTNDMIEDIMCEEKPNQREKSPFRDSRISQLIPKLLFAVIGTLIRNKVKKSDDKTLPLIPYLSAGFLIGYLV